MGCFDNIIGLKELCTTTAPKSGLYLNDIGGSLSLIESVAGKDASGPTDYLNGKINYAVLAIKQELASLAGDKIKTRTVLNDGRIGYPMPNKTVVAGSASYRGIYLTIPANAYYFIFQLARIDLFTDFTGTVTVEVYDLDQEKLVGTTDIETIAGEISTGYTDIAITSDAKDMNLFIGYDSTGINSYKTVTHKAQCCGNNVYRGAHVMARGAVASSFLKQGMTTIADTAGMSIGYSLSCDSEGWMCNFSRQLALAIAHKTMSEIYRSAVMVAPQQRTNNSTTVQADINVSNYEYHDAKYREALGITLKNINLPCGSVCYECKSRYRTIAFSSP